MQSVDEFVHLHSLVVFPDSDIVELSGIFVPKSAPRPGKMCVS